MLKKEDTKPIDYAAMYYQANASERKEERVSEVSETQAPESIEVQEIAEDLPVDMEATRVLSVSAIREALQGAEAEENASELELIEEAEEITKQSTESLLETGVMIRGEDIYKEAALALGVSVFLKSHSVVSEEMKQRVCYITEKAFTNLGIQNVADVEALLGDIMAQEALLSMQKAYCAVPASWMECMALQAFSDVMKSEKSDMLYLVAYEVLKHLSYIQLCHAQALSILLLLKYSRNTNNYTLQHFTQYVEKYIAPFLSALTAEKGVYRQLEYLKCVAFDDASHPLIAVLAHTYPYAFISQGFTEEELSEKLKAWNMTCPVQALVPSFNSNLLKFAAVDEGMLLRMLRELGIQDSGRQEALKQLMTIRDLSLDDIENSTLLERISPMLVSLQAIYDNSVLSTATLSITGLYIAKVHIHNVIGEEFDLSSWL